MPAWQFVGASQALNVARAPVLLTAKITKTAATAAWDAGMSSVDAITGDGFLEFFPPDAGKSWLVGLSVVDTNVDYATIKFGFAFAAGSATYQVFESGVGKTGGIAYAAGDVFRVERRAGTISYFKNGDWVYSSQAADQTGSLRVDTAFFTQNAAPDGIRLYDATSRTWKNLAPGTAWQNVAGAVETAGTSYQRRRLTVATTAKQRAGDQAMMVLAQQGGGFAQFVSATNVTWSFIDIISAGDHRVFTIYRRRVLDSDPSTYTFDLSDTQETVAALLVYRNTDDTAPIGAPGAGQSCEDIFGSTDWACAKRTMTRVSDLYLGLLWQKTSAGTMTVPSDCTLRVNYSPPTTFSYATPRLLAFDFAPEIIGATDAKHVVASVASDGAVASFAIPGVPSPGHGLSWLPAAGGTIGLPPDGI